MPTNYLEYHYQYYYQLPYIKYFHASGIAFLKQPDTKSLLIFYLDTFFFIYHPKHFKVVFFF